MGFVDHIASKMAFFPPTPATYTVKRHSDNGDLYISPMLPGLRKVPDAQVMQLQTRRGSSIVAALISYHLKDRPTLLFSHGNAVDLALMLPFYREIARELLVSILSYDYSGYGCSTGALSVANTLADIDAAYEWLLAHGRKPGDVILYGQSVGSGPTCHLAAKTPDLAGVVLHSALASGMRVVNPGWGWWPSWLDVYHNLRLVPKIKAPVLVMHGSEVAFLCAQGTKDEVVDISAGRALHGAAQHAAEPLWIEGCDHQSVELSVTYLPRMRRFIQSCTPT